MICSQQFTNMRKQSNSSNRAVFQKNLYWPMHATLPIYFYPLPANFMDLEWIDVSSIDKSKLDDLYATVQGKMAPVDAVKAVIKRLFEPLNLNYIYVSNPHEATIRIVFDPNGGSNSGVGLEITSIPLSEPTTYFGWLDVGTFFHELCHVLGMEHEHQNPNNNPIQWNIAAVECMMSETQNPPWTPEMVRANMIDVYAHDMSNGSEYDPESIMLYYYPKSYFCKKEGKELLLTANGASTHENYKLSDMDWLWLTSIYPKTGPRVIPGEPPSSNTTLFIVMGVLLFVVIAGLVFAKISRDKKNR